MTVHAYFVNSVSIKTHQLKKTHNAGQTDNRLQAGVLRIRECSLAQLGAAEHSFAVVYLAGEQVFIKRYIVEPAIAQQLDTECMANTRFVATCNLCLMPFDLLRYQTLRKPALVKTYGRRGYIHRKRRIVKVYQDLIIIGYAVSAFDFGRSGYRNFIRRYQRVIGRYHVKYGNVRSYGNRTFGSVLPGRKSQAWRHLRISRTADIDTGGSA